MTLKTCVKISYKGLTRPIVCDLKFQYDELLNIVLDKFNISVDYKLAIEFYDEQGHKYDKETFEYFLLLFPNPKNIFFIRLDSTKMKTHQRIAVGQLHRDGHDNRIAFGKTEFSNKPQTTRETETVNECDAVPVRRQNCFIGVWPGSLENQQQSSCLQKTEKMISLEIVKRMKLFKQSSPKKKRLLNNPNVFKRSLRV